MEQNCWADQNLQSAKKGRRRRGNKTTDVFGIIQHLDTADHAVFEIKQTCFGGRFSCCIQAKSNGPTEFGWQAKLFEMSGPED
jgi:hypothetical protein